MPDLDWKWIAGNLGVPTFILCLLMAMLHFDLIAPMNSREERHVTNQEQLAKALNSQTEILRTIAYDQKYGTWRITSPPPPSAVETTAPSPPPQPK